MKGLMLFCAIGWSVAGIMLLIERGMSPIALAYLSIGSLYFVVWLVGGE